MIAKSTPSARLYLAAVLLVGLSWLAPPAAQADSTPPTPAPTSSPVAATSAPQQTTQVCKDEGEPLLKTLMPLITLVLGGVGGFAAKWAMTSRADQREEAKSRRDDLSRAYQEILASTMAMRRAVGKCGFAAERGHIEDFEQGGEAFETASLEHNQAMARVTMLTSSDTDLWQAVNWSSGIANMVEPTEMGDKDRVNEYLSDLAFCIQVLSDVGRTQLNLKTVGKATTEAFASPEGTSVDDLGALYAKRLTEKEIRTAAKEGRPVARDFSTKQRTPGNVRPERKRPNKTDLIAGG